MKPCAGCPTPAKCKKAGKCMKSARPKLKSKSLAKPKKRGY